jgi:hypothetical protein
MMLFDIYDIFQIAARRAVSSCSDETWRLMPVAQQCAVIYRELRRLDAEVFGQSGHADGGTSEPVGGHRPSEKAART